MGGEGKFHFFESLSLYLVMRLRSRKLGEPVRRGMERDRDRLPLDRCGEASGEVADEEDEESSDEEEEELDEESSESEDESELDDEEEEELES